MTTSSQEDQVAKWVRDLVIPQLTNSRDEDVEVRISVPKDTFFLSALYFVAIHDKVADRRLDVVVKTPPPLNGGPDFLNMGAQFHNEILFYENFSCQDDIRIPKCLHRDSKPEGTVLVLENLSKSGYSVDSARDLSLRHALVAAKELAALHASAYALKHRDPGKFFRLVSRIRETRFIDDGDRVYRTMVNSATPRALAYLRKIGYEDTAFLDKLQPVFEDAFERLCLGCLPAEERFMVLTHGDFTKYNVMFRRSREAPGEDEAVLIDFACLRYASPVLDLGTFAIVAWSPEALRANFSPFLETYYRHLTERLRKHGLRELFTYEELLEEYRRKALYAFVIISYFLPHIRGVIERDEIGKRTAEENIKCCLAAGGDELSRELSDYLFVLRDHGCLDHLL